MISSTCINDFKILHFEEFGEEISEEKATELAVSLLTVFNCVYRPIKKDWIDEFSKNKFKYQKFYGEHQK